MTTDTPSLGEHRVDAAMSAAIDADASRTGRPGDCVDTDVIRNPDFRRAFAAAVIAEYVEEAANPSYVPYCPEVAASVAAVGKAVLDNTLRAATLDLYTPPFRYENGYVWDDNNHVVTDDGGEFVTGVIASRIRGWGRIQYMDKPRGRAAALQDDVGNASQPPSTRTGRRRVVHARGVRVAAKSSPPSSLLLSQHLVPITPPPTPQGVPPAAAQARALLLPTPLRIHHETLLPCPHLR